MVGEADIAGELGLLSVGNLGFLVTYVSNTVSSNIYARVAIGSSKSAHVVETSQASTSSAAELGAAPV